MKLLLLVLTLSTILKTPVTAQGSAAFPFIQIEPSAELAGMGGAFTALPAENPFGHFFNPAQTGIFSQTRNISVQYVRFDYLPGYRFDDLYFKSYGVSFGYNFMNSSRKKPLSLGMGYMRGYLNLGMNIWTDEYGNQLGTFHSREWYDAFSFGACLTYLAEFSVGFTYKSIVSKLSPRTVTIGTDSGNGKSDASALDMGLMIIFPVHKLYSDLFRDIREKYNVYPVTDISYGLAVTNIGDEVLYVDKSHPHPLPRQAKMGFGLTAGLQMKTDDFEFNLVELQFSAEANDFLFKRNPDGSTEYQSFPGDISFGENIVRNESTSLVEIRRGFSISLFNTVRFNYGRFNSYSYTYSTSGYSVSSKTFFYYISRSLQSKRLKKLFRHTDISYCRTEYKRVKYDYPLSDRKYSGISVSVYGL